MNCFELARLGLFQGILVFYCYLSASLAFRTSDRVPMPGVSMAKLISGPAFIILLSIPLLWVCSASVLKLKRVNDSSLVLVMYFGWVIALFLFVSAVGLTFAPLMHMTSVYGD